MKNPNQISLEQLTQIIDDQRQILIGLHIAIENMERIKVDKYEHEKDIKLKSFFQNYWFQCKFISVIQLTKLLSPKRNEKRSFRALARRLSSASYCEEINKLLESNKDKFPKICTTKLDVINLSSSVNKILDENENLISKLVLLRDKYYAHKDEEKLEYGIISDQLFELTNLAKEIYNQFSMEIFWTQLRLDLNSIGGIDNVLFHMNFSKQKDLEELAAKKNRTVM